VRERIKQRRSGGRRRGGQLTTNHQRHAISTFPLLEYIDSVPLTPSLPLPLSLPPSSFLYRVYLFRNKETFQTLQTLFPLPSLFIRIFPSRGSSFQDQHPSLHPSLDCRLISSDLSTRKEELPDLEQWNRIAWDNNSEPNNIYATYTQARCQSRNSVQFK